MQNVSRYMIRLHLAKARGWIWVGQAGYGVTKTSTAGIWARALEEGMGHKQRRSAAILRQTDRASQLTGGRGKMEREASVLCTPVTDNSGGIYSKRTIVREACLQNLCVRF